MLGLPPNRVVPSRHLPCFAAENITRWELFKASTLGAQCFHLRGQPDASIRTIPDVQGDYADVVPYRVKRFVLLVIDYKGEHSSQLVGELFETILKSTGG